MQGDPTDISHKAIKLEGYISIAKNIGLTITFYIYAMHSPYRS